MNNFRPGPGRVMVEIEGETILYETSADYGGGVPIATNTEEWSKAVKEVGTLVDIGGIFSSRLHLNDRKRYNFFSGMDDATHQEWVDNCSGFEPGRKEMLAPIVGKKVIFSFKSYFDLWEMMGIEKDQEFTVGECKHICPLIEEIVAFLDDDGEWKPIPGSGNKFISLDQESQGCGLDSEKGVYLLYRSLGLPLMDKRQATGKLLEQNIVRVNDEQIVATVRK